MTHEEVQTTRCQVVQEVWRCVRAIHFNLDLWPGSGDINAEMPYNYRPGELELKVVICRNVHGNTQCLVVVEESDVEVAFSRNKAT